MRLMLASAALFALAAQGPAFASSPDEWEAFRKDVEAKCTEALPEKLRRPITHVDQTGTESFGIALIAGRSPSEKARVTFVCVYDKQAKTVEVSGPIGPEYVRLLNDKQREAVQARREKAAAGADAAADEGDDEMAE